MAKKKTRHKTLTSNQIRGFWAAWAGWMLDGMDSFIYALVLIPALRELLPASRINASAGQLGFYGGLLFALFLIGWGLAFLWGPIADRFGRVRTLMLTILCYSVFTFAGIARKQCLAARCISIALRSGNWRRVDARWCIYCRRMA